MIHRIIAYSLILLGIGGTVYMGIEGIYGDDYEVPGMTFSDFERAYSDSSVFVLIDVRSDAEIAAKPAPWEGAIHMPLLTLESRSHELNRYKREPMLVLCPTGNRSRQGARILRLAGYDAVYLERGMFEEGKESDE